MVILCHDFPTVTLILLPKSFYYLLKSHQSGKRCSCSHHLGHLLRIYAIMILPLQISKKTHMYLTNLIHITYVSKTTSSISMRLPQPATKVYQLLVHLPEPLQRQFMLALHRGVVVDVLLQALDALGV